MNGVSLNGVTAAVESTVLRNAETATARNVSLLKKALEADKNMVETLLPSASNRIDIRA